MLTGKHVVFLGGDARQLEVIKSCIQMNAKVSLIGYDNLQSPFSGAAQKELNQEVLQTADILVLPIIGTDEYGQVASVFTSKKLVLTEEHIQSLPKHCIIFAGMAKSYLQNLCKAHEIRIIELLDRDDVAIYNSIPTVEGALMMAIQNTDITLHGSVCVVLGLGRVGMSLARTLHAIGAKVRVGVRGSNYIARAFEMGVESFDLAELSEQVQDADVIFNTIPALVVTAPILAQMPYDVVIIDLASKPGGIDYAFAQKRGIKAILAPSLPGIVAPKTAGRILGRTITQLMTHAIQREGSFR
ncbi:dipicolinate synthase subunit DpsA [Paenactinomyces guangxiensis]|uniref:Dipicolinate synthase subunit DpsA n=1 Tax=Paenactinomyces guangxiensis TaxID=1490290 RepID=A0A7W1WQV5_9BACL|nr:dipicolinate synthase subunit DpsA [Paenactinomyces guangxiensis]MBA4494385.1 dipicolinate synthase subunit DpsA [Paenactinomyces guangxiensis]MBH8591560.1 dipicolinate synthase subunit DpsA [Paenactinomyces guangxiensis]